MATIREYSRQFGAQAGDFSGRRATPEDMGVAGGVADLAQGIGQASAIMKHHEENAELAYAQVQVAEAENVLDEKVREIQAKATPGVSTTDEIKSMTSNYYAEMGGKYKTQKAQQYIKMHGINQTGNRVKSSVSFDADLFARDMGVKRTDLLEGAAKSVYENHLSYESKIARVKFDVQNRLGVFASTGDPRADIAMSEITKKGLNKIAWYAGQGAIDHDPSIRGAIAGSTRPLEKVTATGWESVAQAIFGQESSSGKANTSAISSQQVTGPMQIQKETFEGLKKNGIIPKDYEWTNPTHNKEAGFLHVKDLYQKFDGDVSKVAAMYYASPGVINQDGTINTHWKNKQRPNDPTVGEYIEQVAARVEKLGGTVTRQEIQEKDIPKTIQNAPWWEDLDPQQRHNLMNQAEQKNKREQAVADRALANTIKDHEAEMKTTGQISSPIGRNAFGTNVAAYQSYEAMRKGGETVRNIMLETPANQAAALEAMKPQPGTMEPGVYAQQAEQHKWATTFVKEANQLRFGDPIAHAKKYRYSTENPIREIEPQDIADPEKVVGVLGVRFPQASAVSETGGAKFKVLDDGEAKMFRAVLEQKTPKELKSWVESVTAMENTKEVRALFKQVFPNDRSLNIAADMSLAKTVAPEKKNADVDAILFGRSIMKANVKGDGNEEEKSYKNARTPSNESAYAIVSNYVKKLDVPVSRMDSYVEAITAHYIGSSLAKNPSQVLDFKDKDVGSANVKAFEKSIEAVIGDKDGNYVGTKAGNTVVPRPYGMDDGTFKNRVQEKVHSLYGGKYKWGEYSMTLSENGEGYNVHINGKAPLFVNPSAASSPIYPATGYDEYSRATQENKSTAYQLRDTPYLSGAPKNIYSDEL